MINKYLPFNLLFSPFFCTKAITLLNHIQNHLIVVFVDFSKIIQANHDQNLLSYNLMFKVKPILDVFHHPPGMMMVAHASDL